MHAVEALHSGQGRCDGGLLCFEFRACGLAVGVELGYAAACVGSVEVAGEGGVGCQFESDVAELDGSGLVFDECDVILYECHLCPVEREVDVFAALNCRKGADVCHLGGRLNIVANGEAGECRLEDAEREGHCLGVASPCLCRAVECAYVGLDDAPCACAVENNLVDVLAVDALERERAVGDVEIPVAVVRAELAVAVNGHCELAAVEHRAVGNAAGCDAFNVGQYQLAGGV